MELTFVQLTIYTIIVILLIFVCVIVASKYLDRANTLENIGYAVIKEYKKYHGTVTGYNITETSGDVFLVRLKIGTGNYIWLELKTPIYLDKLKEFLQWCYVTRLESYEAFEYEIFLCDRSQVEQIINGKEEQK